MSKAFTRESDAAPEMPMAPRPSPLPPGAKNYITPGGARMLREELDRLLQQISRRDNQTGPTPSSQELTQRISMLQQSLESATVVPPPGPTEDRVRFGATVTALERGVEVRYRIVGVDEVDFDRGWVSWLSPIAKSLLNARVGDRVRLRTPAGEETLEIRTIDYE